jgi:pSer/pThr/pTyr-binding forkhead associated (FHA) protein
LVNEAALRRLADETGGTVLKASRPEELLLLYQKIADQLKNQYLLRFTSTFGRGPDNLLVLHDDQGSDRHAEILASPDGFLIRDLGSANGTTVNGQPVTEAYLKIGDDIGIGTTHLTFTD